MSPKFASRDCSVAEVYGILNRLPQSFLASQSHIFPDYDFFILGSIACMFLSISSNGEPYVEPTNSHPVSRLRKDWFPVSLVCAKLSHSQIATRSSAPCDSIHRVKSSLFFISSLPPQLIHPPTYYGSLSKRIPLPLPLFYYSYYVQQPILFYLNAYLFRS